MPSSCPPRRPARLLVLVLALAACGGSGEADGADGGEGPGGDDGGPLDRDGGVAGDATPIDPPQRFALAAARVTRWPAGAREVTLRIEATPADASSIDRSAAITATDLDGAPLASAARAIELPVGYLAVVAAPVDADRRAAQADAVRALLDARPSGQKVALFAWRGGLDQLVGFTDDDSRLARAADQIAELGAIAAPLDPGDALGGAAEAVEEVGGKQRSVMRAVLLVGAAPPAGLSFASALRGATGDDLTASALAAAAELDGLAGTAYYQVGVCGGLAAGAARVVLGDGEGEVAIGLPATLPEEGGGACAPEVVFGARALPTVIDFQFTAAQRQVYDARVAGQSKEWFDLSISLDGGPPIVATAHLRGLSSMGCQRKSYAVTLDGPGRTLFAGSTLDEIDLLGMCLDDHYSQQYTGNALLAARGLFPLDQRLVELRLDGVTRGVYLMVEKPDDDLRREDSRPRAVLRRTFAPPNTPLEVKWTALGSDAAAISSWEDFEDTLVGKSGAALRAAVRRQLELEDYLDLLAMASALRNGDYVDEVYLTSNEAVDDGGAAVDFFRATSWDLDDLFSDCHHGGDHAFPDPYGLAYCAEAPIDKLLLADAETYARFVARLEVTLAWLTPARFAAALEATEGDLVPFFDSAAICGASVELLAANPANSSPAVAKQSIRDHLAQMSETYAARRALLLQRIAAYHAAN